MPNSMKDYCGQELRVGQWVAMIQPKYFYSLAIGQIIKICDFKVRVRWKNGGRTEEILREPTQLVVHPNSSNLIL